MEGFATGPNWSEHWKKVQFTFSDDEDDFDCENQEEIHEATITRGDGIHWRHGGGDDDDDDDNNNNCYQGGGTNAVSNRRMSSCEICAVGTRRRSRNSVQIRETVARNRISYHNRFSEDNEMPNAACRFTGRFDDQMQNIRRNRSSPDPNPHRQRPESFHDRRDRRQQGVDNTRTASQICEICFCDGLTLVSRACCSFPVCLWCFRKYLTTRIDEGDDSVHCINYECRKEISDAEIFRMVSVETADKFKRILAEKRRSVVQACPSCNTITVVSDRILNRHVDSKTPDLFVICPVCDKVWTYDRSIPRHLDGKLRRRDDADFERWTRRTTDSRRNARRCPACKVFIQKSGGCDRMSCTRCETSFCYLCGGKFEGGKHNCVEVDAALPSRSALKNSLSRLVQLIKSKRT